MIKTGKILLLFVLITTAGGYFLGAEASEEITMIIPEIKTVSVDMPYRVAISNPAIADINTVTEKEVVLVPKAAGKTTLVVWDNRGQRAYSIRVVSEDLKDIKIRIDKLVSELNYPNVYSKISNEEGKILLLGSVYSQDEKDRLDTVFANLKEKIIDMVEIKLDDQLVQIDVEVLELSKSAMEDLGFDWSTPIDDADTAAIKWTEQPWTADGTFDQDIYHLLRLSRIWDRGAVSMKLNLIITQGKGRVLSRPKLVCLSGKEANFLVGGEVPVLSTIVTSGGTSVNVEYKDYGISLEIKPTVKPNGFIQAALKTEVSEIDDTRGINTSTIVAPAFTKRTAETELYLRENQTVFLAGLIQNKDSKNLSKLPALGDIPILGVLFRSKDFTSNETELVISLTPRIIRQESRTELAKAEYEQHIPKSLLSYIRTVKERITRAVVYPDMARKSNAQGEVSLSLHILSDGRLLNVIINKSSGNEMLDKASTNIVKAQAPFPPFPASSNLNDIWIDIPIVFENN